MSNYNDYLELNSLYHHGLKGMRWGIRRYQNEDGSLTLAEKKRYGIDPIAKAQNYSPDRKKEIAAGKTMAGLMLASVGGILLTSALLKKRVAHGAKIALGIAAGGTGALVLGNSMANAVNDRH